MASEWKEKGGGDDFDDEGLPLLRKHTQVRPNTRSADSVYSLQTAFLVRPRRNDAGVGATPSLFPAPRTRPNIAEISTFDRCSILDRFGGRTKGARARPPRPPRATSEDECRAVLEAASWRELAPKTRKRLLNFVFQPPT
jgi:hypothetical protein